MNKPSLIQETQAIEQLLREDSHQCRAQSTKLVLFDQFVQIHAEQFKHETKVLPMDECVFEP